MSVPDVFELFGSVGLSLMLSIHCVEHGEFGVTLSADESGTKAKNIESALDKRIV
jgi:hypothetical protein